MRLILAVLQVSAQDLLSRLPAEWSCQANVSCIMERLYPEHAGFDEGGTAGDELTYGEITPLGIEQLVNKLPLGLNSEDAFFDLGSGVGKAVIQAFLTSPLRLAVGVELAESRHKHATRALRSVAEALHVQAVQDVLHLDGRTLRFAQSNALTFDFTAATVAFVSSLAMPRKVIRGLQDRISSLVPGTLAAFSTKLAGCHRGLHYLEKLNLEMTWLSSSAMYLYLVTPDESPESLWGSTRLSRLKDKPAPRHRVEGELGSATACVAAELEALMNVDPTETLDLGSVDITARDHESKGVLDHICDQHTASSLAVTQYGKNALFAKHQAAKREVLRKIIQALLPRDSSHRCSSLAKSAGDHELMSLLHPAGDEL